MDKGNVLVIGNSGVGKSTLINTVVGKEVAPTSFGAAGTTKELEIYESSEVPFRVIDTVGFEPGFIKKNKAINSVKKWSRESAEEGKEEQKIDVIWFCVDGTSSKLFPEHIKSLTKATKMWKSVPVVVVITKSYSVPDREKNVKMVEQAFVEQKKRKKKEPKYIIPVVAETFTLNETAAAPPEGIIDLIDATNELMPEGKEAARKDLYDFKLKKIRMLAHSLVSVSTVSAVTIGFVPVPITDAAILSAIEVGLINGLAKIYKIDKEETDLVKTSVTSVVSITAVAKTTLSALKSIPGINIGASVAQAIVAGAFVSAIGEGFIYIFEKVYIGEKELSDIDWIENVLDGQFSNEFTEKVFSVVDTVNDNQGIKDVDMKKLISSLIVQMFSDNETETAD